MKFRDVTLCYIIKNHKWLMLLRNKKENDINEGKWIGVGGKVEDSETIEECIIREIKEETGLNPFKVDFRGVVDFIYEFKDYEKIWVYICRDFEGEIKDCDEGTLAWIDEEDILDLDLWEGDIVFLKKLIENNDELFHFELKYDEQGNLVNIIDKGVYKL